MANSSFVARHGLTVNTNVIVTSGANVGIGTTTPNAKLQVVGTANISGNVAVGGDQTVAGNLVVTGTITGSTTVDLSTYSGNIAGTYLKPTATILGANGTSGAPTYSFLSETNSGWYRSGIGSFTYAIGGVAILTANSTVFTVPALTSSGAVNTATLNATGLISGLSLTMSGVVNTATFNTTGLANTANLNVPGTANLVTVNITGIAAHTANLTLGATNTLLIGTTVANSTVYTGQAYTANSATYLGASDLATAANYMANTANKILQANSVWASAVAVTIAYAATVTPDFNSFINAKTTLTGNITLGAPTNVKKGQTGVWEFTHSGAARTLSYNTTYWKAASGFALSTTGSGAVDYVSYYGCDDGKVLISVIKNPS